MDAGLLETLMGGDRTWAGPCVVVIDGEGAVKVPGPDNIAGGGVKTYAPRYSSGRIEADACCLLRDQRALLVVRQQTHRDATGLEIVRQTLMVVDLGHVVGVEYAHVGPLRALGIAVPFIPEDGEYRPGALVG